MCGHIRCDKIRRDYPGEVRGGIYGRQDEESETKMAWVCVVEEYCRFC